MNRGPILPPACLLIAILLMVALHFLAPIRHVVPSPYTFIGVLPGLIGVALNLWADRLFTREQTTVKPFEQSAALITDGPYRLSRHPMYLGMVLILIGIGVALGSIPPFLIIPAFVLVVHVKFIVPEERAMEDTFGAAYREYRRRVRRWI